MATMHMTTQVSCTQQSHYAHKLHEEPVGFDCFRVR